jgi:hypothetical protein
MVRWLPLLSLITLLVQVPAEAACPLRQCRRACADEIRACAAGGMKRSQCRREVLGACKRNGLETCRGLAGDGAAAVDAATADTIAPSIPAGLVAEVTSCSLAVLMWAPAVDTGGAGLAGYKLYRNGTFVRQVTGALAIERNLAGSTTFSYAVSAIDKAGNESARSAAVSARTPACSAAAPALVGCVAAVGAAKDVVVVGNRAYLASAEFGLSIMDVSTPGRPLPVGVANPPFYAERVAVSGTRAILSGNSLGLKVVDIADPTRPRVLGSLAGTMKGVQISGSLAYAIQVVPGNPARIDLLVIDLAQPSAPTVIGRQTVAGGTELRVVNGIAYVAAGAAGLQIVDVRTPRTPRLLATLNTPGSGRAVTVAGSMAYVADGTAVVAVDVSDPSRPTIRGSAATSAVAVAATGSRLYVLDGLNIKILDVSVPATPTLRYNGTGWGAQGVAAAGTLVYLASPDTSAATQKGGLYVVDAATITAPRLLGNVYGGFDNWAVGVDGGTAVVAGNSLGLKVVDVRDPVRPKAVGALAGTMKGVAMAAGHAFALQVIPGNPARTELAVVDVRQPATPVVVGRLPLPAGLDIKVMGGYAFIPAGAAGLQVVDVRTPSAPRMVMTVDTPGSGYGVAVRDGYAYVADGSAVAVVDVRTPTSSRLVKNIPTAATDVATGPGRLYVVGGQQLKVVNVSVPTAPVVQSTTPAYGAQGVAAMGNHVFLATPALNHFDTTGGIYLVNASNPAAPVLVRQQIVPGTTRTVVEAGGRVYAGDSAALVDVFAVP